MAAKKRQGWHKVIDKLNYIKWQNSLNPATKQVIIVPMYLLMIPETSKETYNFSDKKEAIKFAKKYMKKNPRGFES